MQQMMHRKSVRIFISLLLFLTFALLLCPQMVFCQQAQQSLYLSMEDAIDRALGKNNQLRASMYDLKRARWERINAWTMLLPEVTFNSRYTWIDDSTYALRDFSRYFADGSGGAPDTSLAPMMPTFSVPKTVWQEMYRSSIDVNMTLFNYRLYNGIAMANTAKDIAEKMNESTRENTLFQVISSYLNFMHARAIYDLQKEYLDLSRLNFEKAERMHRAGRYSKMEVLRWQVDYQQQKSIVENSASGVRTTEAALARVLNLDMQTHIEGENDIPDMLTKLSGQFKNLSEDEILNMIRLDNAGLIKANAALAAAKSNEKLAKKNYGSTYASYLPNVNLNYSYGWQENNTVALDAYSPQTLMINLSWSLFNGFKDYSQTKASYYAYKKSQEEFNDQLQNIRFVLTETVNKILNLRSQMELSETNVAYSEQNYRIVEQQKGKGLVSNIEFIDAKLNMQNARLADLRNQYDFIAAVVELQYLTGKLKNMIE